MGDNTSLAQCISIVPNQNLLNKDLNGIFLIKACCFFLQLLLNLRSWGVMLSTPIRTVFVVQTKCVFMSQKALWNLWLYFIPLTFLNNEGLLFLSTSRKLFGRKKKSFKKRFKVKFELRFGNEQWKYLHNLAKESTALFENLCSLGNLYLCA